MNTKTDNNKNEKVLVAMSGGVDSSVTAHLLKEQGYNCCGATMQLHNEKACGSLQDIEDARSVAARLGMDFMTFNFIEDFNHFVICPFIECYERGETPNPCIECNKHLKFNRLLEEALKLGCDKIATGHYARVSFENGKYKLKKAVDLTKDQSYVLYSLTQEQLSHIIFPLGEMTKSKAREIALAQGFVNAKKHDSQDICFVPDGDYAGMIKRFTGKDFCEGDFVDTNGNLLGKHKGIIHYTIGQRKGLGISAKAPLYVLKIDADNNQVVLGSNEELFNHVVNVKEFHWMDGDDEIPSDRRCKAKIRYKHTEQFCNVHYNGDKTATIIFDEPQRAITPGQLAVLYDDDTVLGGGIIY